MKQGVSTGVVADPGLEMIPTYVFDEHNEAYYYWHKAQNDGYLGKPLDIYHVDAHSDMGTVKKLRHSVYWDERRDVSYLKHYREIAEKDLNIANFIIPAVLDGIAKNIYFIYPQWRKYKRSIQRLNVASAFGEGKVIKHGIKMTPSEAMKINMAYPDLTQYRCIRTDIEHVPARRRVILDIDLDYFACTDSITNRMSFELAITADQYVNRNYFIRDNQTLQYCGLKIGFRKRGGEHFAVIHFKKTEDKDYFPTESEIKREVDKLLAVLINKKIKPAAITICRSSISGYCPPQYFKFIEDYLLLKLKIFFPAIKLEK